MPSASFSNDRPRQANLRLVPKVRDVKTILLHLLPTTITLRRADQINVILTPALHQVTGFNVSGINQMFVR
jgi:hypothetical protein